MTSLPRSIAAARLSKLPNEEIDVLVVGSGIAGLTVAATLERTRSVTVMTKGRAGTGSTLYAQGGVAASVAADDTPALHLQDTLVAGAGLCDVEAVRVLVEEGPDAVAFLEAHGVRLDLEGLSLAVTREGGHSRRRVVHAGGDATGAEIVRALTAAVASTSVRLVEECFLLDIVTDADGAVAGALVSVAGELRLVRCRALVLASGGYGQLYEETTSPRPCTGDGAAAALRAGAALADMEFVQFHPTTLFVEDDPRPLLSEAMRGEGARLIDAAGGYVMDGVHPLGDLAPRDVVARAMFQQMAARGLDHLYLDARPIGLEQLEHHFPTILGVCRSHGIDPVTEPIPVAPACHYTMGGVRTDIDGRSNLPGLYAVGEVASSGVHGANRLASNSLLEGAVFGRRAAAAIAKERRGLSTPLELTPLAESGPSAGDVRPWLRRSMVRRAGVVREEEGLSSLAEEIDRRLAEITAATKDEEAETANLLMVAAVVVNSALLREESRGAHFRSDHRETEADFRCHQFATRGADNSLSLAFGQAMTDEVGKGVTALG